MRRTKRIMAILLAVIVSLAGLCYSVGIKEEKLADSSAVQAEQASSGNQSKESFAESSAELYPDDGIESVEDTEVPDSAKTEQEIEKEEEHTVWATIKTGAVTLLQKIRGIGGNQSIEKMEVTSNQLQQMVQAQEETEVVNAEVMRAATYQLKAAEEDLVLKYFPVTLYDYDAPVINAATAALDTSNPTMREGMYFNDDGANTLTDTTISDKTAFVEGQYYIQNLRASENGVGSWLVGNQNGITSTSNQSAATLWTLGVHEDGTYSLKCTVNGAEQYMKVGNGNSSTNTDGLSTSPVSLSLTEYSHNQNAVQIGQNISGTTYYLCQWGGSYVTSYGGYNVNNDTGNGMCFYRVEDDTQTLTTIKSTTITYAEWNYWNKKVNDSANGQLLYTGLAETALDENKNIVYKKTEGGIFNGDTSVKNIYSNVQMPFVYEDGYYVFDSTKHGVYFHEDVNQGSSGIAADGAKLYFDNAAPQAVDPMRPEGYNDGSTRFWLPYNDGTTVNASDCNYHFGLKATIPFTMTANGRIAADDDESDPITFNFSGDDDVWIFIDGRLVVDLGGIHNRLDATINFAENTVTYEENNISENPIGSFNDSDFALEQTLFGGLITQDRETFAAGEQHELTVFYLERGGGSSNCRITFNMPIYDSVTVTKQAKLAWSELTDEETTLTAAEQAIVDHVDFPFVLYHKKSADAVEYEPVANTSYYLLNDNGQVIHSTMTDAEGRFTLRNGQSARFILAEMNDADGVTYYVEEEPVAGFKEPDYIYSGESANSYLVNDKETYTTAAEIPELECYHGVMTSDKIRVTGVSEAEDSLVFLCENFLDAELPNPSTRPVDDKVVLDYGLPVEIDVLANDIHRGDTHELIAVSGDGMSIDTQTGAVLTEGKEPAYGTVEIKNGKLLYTLQKPLSGIEVLNYIVKASGTSIHPVTNAVTTVYEYGVAKVYIIPATTMYYEEDFSDLVTFTSGTWETIGIAETDYQESGLVGTLNDSPYGSDVAYLNDSGDSNGASRYVSTESAPAQFQYTFTGWGTSFYGRVSDNSGGMRITITDEQGKMVYVAMRNTIYQAGDMLYNIPVFNYMADDYGTYTVTVTVARKIVTADGNVVYGSDFWLDGIKVYQPLNRADEHVLLADSAYATDTEANHVSVKLREKLLTDVTTYDADGNFVWTSEDRSNGNFILFTDVMEEMKTAADYESKGPKEEVYLYSGQKISFALNDWGTNKLYLGMKAPKGSGTVIVNGTEIVLNNTADCYFDITNYVSISTDDTGKKTASCTIQAKEGSLISLTDMKVTGNYQFALIGSNEKNTTENIDVIVLGYDGREE